MAISYTSRLQLAKPDADEFQLVSVIDSNSDIIDKGVGSRMVAPGVIPPVNEMYDGLVVNERDTGKTWIASANAAGGYDRAWIRYPWQCNTLSAGYTLAHNSTVSPVLLFQTGGTNTTSADVVGGNVITPVSGIYRVDIGALFGPNDNSGTNWRSVSVEINGAADAHSCSYVPYNQANSNQRYQYSSMPLTLAAGAKIAGRQFQNSLLPMPGCSVAVVVTLITVTGKNNN